MAELDSRKLIGAFVYVIAICFLILAVIGILNKADYIYEYQQCIDVAKQEFVDHPELMQECKDNASQGLGFKIRQNQAKISTIQYIQVYTVGVINVLLAVLLLIIGKVIYNMKPKRPVIIKKEIELPKTSSQKRKTTKSKRSKKKKRK
jgi:hypothetical protein